MNKKIKLTLSMVLFLPLLVSLEAHAKIYKCVGTDTKVYYNDKPCPVTSTEKEMKASKDPVNGYIPPKFVADAPEKSSKGIMVGGDSSKNIGSENKESSKASNNGGNGGGQNSGSDSGAETTASKTNESKQSIESNVETQNNVESGDNNSEQELENVTYIESKFKEEK